MKISDLTPNQIKTIRDARPVWLGKNCPSWMVYARAEDLEKLNKEIPEDILKLISES
jgi:hypothetical protein